MATKTKEKGAYSKAKNGQAPIKVKAKPVSPEVKEIIAEGVFPETKQIAKIEKMDMPLTTVEEATAMWERYQKLINALMKQEDVVEIQGKKRIKKSGINKVARFFGYNCEITRAYKDEEIGPQGGKYFVWRVWAKTIAPNGRFRVAGAACASNERRFAHIQHDVYATAETRAKKRAIEELAGMGEIELLEEEQVPPAQTDQGAKDPSLKAKERKVKLNQENPEYFHPLPSADQKKWVKVVLAKLNWKIQKPVEKLTKEEAKSILNRGFKAAKRRKINLKEETGSDDIAVVEDNPEGTPEPK